MKAKPFFTKRFTLFASIMMVVMVLTTMAVASYAWFATTNVMVPSQSVSTSSMHTDAFVYNKNSNHTNDDSASTAYTPDSGGTLSYDHSKDGSVVEWYIVGDCYTSNAGTTETTGTLSDVNWDMRKSLQMYANPNATSDKAVYFNLHFTVGTMFKVASADGTWLGYSDSTFDHGADLSDHFEAGSNGGNSDNIYCKTECSADVYVNGSNRVAIVSRSDQQEEREVGSDVGFYVVGNTVSDKAASRKASSGAFVGSDFDLTNCYPINFDSQSESDANRVGAYYGLHLYPNDIFKVWDGRSRSAGAGWYGWNSNANSGLLGDSNYFTGTAGSDITTVKEGYFDIFVYTDTVGGSGGGQYVKIWHHVQDAPYTGTIKSAYRGPSGPNIQKTASTTVGHIIYFKPDSNWAKDSARFAIRYNSGNSWASMSEAGVSGYYSVILPSGYTSFSFRRMKGSDQTNNESNQWNYSNDINLPDDNGTDTNKILYDKSNNDWWDTWTDTTTGMSVKNLRYYLVGNQTSGLSGNNNNWEVANSNYYAASGSNHMGGTSKSLPINSEFQVYVCDNTTPIDYLGYSNISADSKTANPSYYTHVALGATDNHIKINRSGTWSIGVNSKNEVYMNWSSYSSTVCIKAYVNKNYSSFITKCTAKTIAATVEWTGVSLTAGDEIKACSPEDPSDNGYYPNTSESWHEKYGSTTNSYDSSHPGMYAVMSSTTGFAGNLVIRYTGTYTITLTTSGVAVTDLRITPTAITAANFVLTKASNDAPSTAVGSNTASGEHRFTWSGASFKIGETFCVETTATSDHANIKGSWGSGFLAAGSANYAHTTNTPCVQDTGKNQLGSMFQITSATITFILEPGSGNISLSSVTVVHTYEADNSTGSPVGIYLSYDTTSAPSSLAYANSATASKIRMNYDEGHFPGTEADSVAHHRNVDNNTYDGDLDAAHGYEVKATLASFTSRTTYYCNIFHNLDKATYMVNKIWYDQSSTYTGHDNHRGGGFTLPAGTYNIYLVGVVACGPWAGGNNNQTNSSDGNGYGDYMVYIQKTNPVAYDEEHEVPVYMVGRGKPGSDLENGDYTNTKITTSPYSVGSPAYRYVPFYAAADQTDAFPCYANLAATDGVTLKAGDRFVFSDGAQKKTTFTNSAGTDYVAVVSSEIVVKRDGIYRITAAKGADDSFANATFTIALKSSSDVRSGNDFSLQDYDVNPSAYSKQHGVRVFNATGSRIDFGGSFDSSLLDSGDAYVSFVIELRHINTGNSGTISAAFASLPIGTKYRFVQKDSTGSDVTAIDDSLSWPGSFTTSASASEAIFNNVDIGTNTTVNHTYDTCYAKSTLIEIKIPYTAFAASAERLTYSLAFSINITFKETMA